MTLEEPTSITVNIPAPDVTPEPVEPVEPVEPMGNDSPSELDTMQVTLASISTGMNMLLERLASIESLMARIEVEEATESSDTPDSEEVKEEVKEAVKDAIEEALEREDNEFGATIETEAGETEEAVSESEQPESSEASGVAADSEAESEQSPRASHFWWRRIGG